MKDIDVEKPMRKTFSGFAFAIFVLGLAQPAFSGPLRLGITAGYYMPSDSAYKDLYGQGNLMFGGSLGFELIRKLELRLEGGYFQDSGKMNLTEEDLKLSFIAASLGARFRFVDGKALQPYVGAGVAMYSYKEDLPARLEDVSKTAVGLQGEVGGYYALTNKILLDLNFRYVLMNTKPLNESVKLGGLRAGLGVAFQF
jgi:opacity protein-like surface antigen